MLPADRMLQALEAHSGGQQDAVGAESHGQQVTHAFHGRVGRDDLAHAGELFRTNALADQEPAALSREQTGGADQHQADHHRRRGVEVRVARGVAETDAPCGNDDPGQCGRILEKTVNTSTSMLR
jgi:hypothetical protein